MCVGVVSSPVDHSNEMSKICALPYMRQASPSVSAGIGDRKTNAGQLSRSAALPVTSHTHRLEMLAHRVNLPVRRERLAQPSVRSL